MLGKTIKSAVGLSLATALVLAVGASSAQAGAWVRPSGGVYARLANKLYLANNIFSAEAGRVAGDWWSDQAQFRELSSNLILEYGLPWDVTVLFENTAKYMYADYAADPNVGGSVITRFGSTMATSGVNW